MKGILSLKLSPAIQSLILSVACPAWAQGIIIGPPPELEPLPPRNDNFADAIVIQTNLHADTTTLYGGTAEVGEPMHGGQEAVYSRWWRWTAPTEGWVEIDAYPERIAVYAGETLSTLQAVELTEPQFNDRKPWRFAAQAGVEYHIAGEPGPPSGYRPDWMFSFRFEFTQLLRTPLASEVKLPPNMPVEIDYKTAVGGARSLR